jgi:7-cyano-7-deazaguanine reductase
MNPIKISPEAPLHEGLKSLGSNQTEYPYTGADPRLLETFPSPLVQRVGVAGRIEIVAPEFTSLCPKTGQPDFATIVVKYRPRELCVESKSFKLFLGSFRNVGMFHEACTMLIAQSLIDLLDPLDLEVEGQFTPRGGIKFWPKVTYTALD